MLWKQCRLPGIHGAVRSEDSEEVHGRANALLRAVLMESGRLQISSEEDEATQILTTGGKAAGPPIGGNIEMIATAAGWALPDLTGAILLLEGINMRLGQLDRLLTMLRKAGHLNASPGSPSDNSPIAPAVPLACCAISWGARHPVARRSRAWPWRNAAHRPGRIGGAARRGSRCTGDGLLSCDD
jgi:hypothetical protein